MDIEAFWNRVKYLIKVKNITQADTARACGVSYDTLRRWMSRGYIPPLYYTYLLAQYLGVSIDYLVSGQNAGRDTQIYEAVLGILEHASRTARLNKAGQRGQTKSN